MVGVVPTAGPADSEFSLVITGANFRVGLRVYFVGSDAATIECPVTTMVCSTCVLRTPSRHVVSADTPHFAQNEAEITCQAPAGLPIGPPRLGVNVTNADGTGTVSDAVYMAQGLCLGAPTLPVLHWSLVPISCSHSAGV